MELYVARHGETEWNVQKRLCGLTDIPLNTKGEAQAQTLANELAAKGIALDAIIASPLIRAQQTAMAVSRQFGIKVETDARLVEQNHGIYEGGSNQNPDFLLNKAQFAKRYPEGESMMQVGARIYTFLDELKQRKDVERVLLVSHGGTCRVLKTYFDDMTNESFFLWRMDNVQCMAYTL